jgi:hypothetical protein
MKIIDTLKTIKDPRYIISYDFKIDNEFVGNSSISKYDLNNTYILKINIPKLEHKNNYKFLVFNTLLKYINTYNKKKNRLIMILPKHNYFEFFTILSLKFKLIEQNADADVEQNVCVFDNSNLLQITKLNKTELTKNFTISKLIKYEKSYIISAAKTEGLLYIPLQNYLNVQDLKEVSNNKNKPFLLWVKILENYKFDELYFHTNCYIMNILDDRSTSIITNKFNLYFNFKKYFSNECKKYMAESWDLHSFINNTNLKSRITNKNEVFIVRPAGIGAFSGKDIYIVNNNENLKEAVNKTSKYNNVLITEYITNPLLFEGKKFHIRVYFIVGLIQGHFMTKVLNLYKILTAGKPYINENFYNKEIHDTHAKTTDRDIIFPIDIYDSRLYNNFSNIYFNKIQDCLLTVSKFINGKLTKYSQAQNAFEIFGCDFLIKDNDEIVLMEINDKVGYSFKSTETSIKFSKLYFQNIIYLILEPLLKSENISENKSNWLFFE